MFDFRDFLNYFFWFLFTKMPWNCPIINFFGGGGSRWLRLKTHQYCLITHCYFKIFKSSNLGSCFWKIQKVPEPICWYVNSQTKYFNIVLKKLLEYLFLLFHLGKCQYYIIRKIWDHFFWSVFLLKRYLFLSYFLIQKVQPN